MGTSAVVAFVFDTPLIIGVVVLLVVAILGLLTHGVVSGGDIGAPWTKKPRRHFRG